LPELGDRFYSVLGFDIGDVWRQEAELLRFFLD
jgi:hypothetical protein